MNLTKTCTKCKKIKELSLFKKCSRNKSGITSHCKACATKYSSEYSKKHRKKRSEYLKQWNKNNPEKVREQKYRHRYGITIQDYEFMLLEQNHRCKICKSDNLGRDKYFHVDHCHITKEVRGLLCDSCNKGLGHFKDDPEILSKAIEYLQLK